MLRLYTHNIRYANPEPWKSERLWKERKFPLIASILLHTNGTNGIVCLQEVLYEQLQDISEELGPDWTYVGIGRDDGDKKGEFGPIYYRKELWKVDATPYWLGPTPQKPSRGWDAALPRVVIEAQFQSRKDPSVKFVLYCTHFDHKGATAREKSAKLVLELAAKYKGPKFLCGDLNSEPDEAPYKVLAKELKDSKHSAPVTFGHKNTYTSFGDEPHTRIDYIWHSSDVQALQYSVPHSDYGFLFSDHRPVVVDFHFS